MASKPRTAISDRNGASSGALTGRARGKGRGDSLAIDWGALAPLRIRARAVAEGVYAGMHRSVKKGAGVEFGGQRAYVPGDDLRFIDRRALLRHDRLMVREFETETDRAIWLCVDATLSMSFRGPRAPGSKVAYAALCAAALARVALATGDPVGLAWLGGRGAHGLSAMAGREAFERIAACLESIEAAGDALLDAASIERAFAPIGRKARRGSVIVLFSDLIDLPDRALAGFSSLATSGRALIAVQVLDPTEAELDFSGNVRLRALEGDAVVETDADAVRETYQARLAAISDAWSSELAARGGRFIASTSADPPEEIVRRIVQAIAEARR